MTERNGWRIRVLIVTVLIVFMFFLIMARMIQLSLFSAELYKIQSSMSSETKALKSELTDKINEFAAEREAIDNSLKALEQRLLVAKKNELLKEIGDLRLQHQRLVAEVQNLQERVSGLSAVEEETITRILGAYEQTLKKQRKFEFVINFVLGVFSSIIASLLYSLAAHYKLVPRIRMRHIFRKMPIIKKLYRNVRAPSTDVKPPGPS
jgi:ABC-type sugar transport system permease subunit